jgi:hypothetical protein
LGTHVAYVTDEEAAEKDAEIKKGELDTLRSVGILRVVEFVTNIIADFLL